MPASKRFLLPEAIARISRLDLRARFVVEGFLSGIHRSPYFGQSVEFVQHRQYMPGDDLRRVDWKVWAKQDRYYVKQFEEDTDLRATLLVDLSRSMAYGGGPLNKREYACTLAVSLAYLLLRQQDAVGCLAFSDRVRSKAPQRTKRSHLSDIVQTLSHTDPDEKTDLGPVLEEAAESYPRRGLFVLISDLFAERAGLFRGLRLLRQRGHEVLVFHIMDDEELDFPFNGPTRFEGLEWDRQLNCNPRALRAGYLQAVQAFLDEVRHGCAKAQVDYLLARTSAPLAGLLSAYLAKRQSNITHGK